MTSSRKDGRLFEHRWLAMSDQEPQLDPSRFPQRLDLELDPVVIERLQELADRSGRSISEVAAELLGRQMGDRIPPG